MKYKTKLEHLNNMKIDKLHCLLWPLEAELVLLQDLDPVLELNSSGDVTILVPQCPTEEDMREIGKIQLRANASAFLVSVCIQVSGS